MKRRTSGSQRKVDPIFPYSIQTVIKDEKAKTRLPINDANFKRLSPLERNKYIKIPARIG